MTPFLARLRFLALPLAAAAYSLPAAAAFIPTHGNFFHHPSASGTKKPWTILHVRNTSSQARELHIGHNTFIVPAHGSTNLSVTAGALVHVSSPVDSHVNSYLAAVPSSDGSREIVLN